jgi:hypothetical protein
MSSQSLALRFFLDAPPGVPVALPHAGYSTEHPLVFDRVARDLLKMADEGLLAVINQRCSDRFGECIYEQLVFQRLR